jgi:hypothetical protein
VRVSILPIADSLFPGAAVAAATGLSGALQPFQPNLQTSFRLRPDMDRG